MTKEFLFSSLSSVMAHGALIVGLGWQMPAQFGVPPAPTAMEWVVLSQEISSQSPNKKTSQTEDDKQVQEENRALPLESEIPSESKEILKGVQADRTQAQQETVSKIQIGTSLKMASSQFNPPPLYPRAARRKGIEGTVSLLVDITSQGQTAQIKIIHSSGYEILDQAAIKAVKKWKFLPALSLQTPIHSQLEIPIVFQLKD